MMSGKQTKKTLQSMATPYLRSEFQILGGYLGHTDGERNRLKNGQMDGRTDKQIEGEAVGQTDGWMEGWKKRLNESHPKIMFLSAQQADTANVLI